jgi:hypothetical protein
MIFYVNKDANKQGIVGTFNEMSDNSNECFRIVMTDRELSQGKRLTL